MAGCSRIKPGLRVSRLCLDDSYAKDYYTMDERHFSKFGPTIEIMVERELRLWVKADLDAIEELLREFEAKPWFHDSNFTIAWTRSFRRYIESHPINKNNAAQTLREFLVDPEYAYLSYDLDVKIDAKRGSVYASRYLVVSKSLMTTKSEADMMIAARKIADGNPLLNVTVFHSDFAVFDQAANIWAKMLQKVKLGFNSFIPVLIASRLRGHWLCCAAIQCDLKHHSFH